MAESAAEKKARLRANREIEIQRLQKQNQKEDQKGKDQKMVDQATAVQADVEAGRPVIKAESAYNLESAVIEQALADGWVRWSGGTPQVAGTRETAHTDVTISADKSPTKKEETQPYEKLEAITFEGMVLLAGGKAEPAVLRGDEKVDPRTAEERIKGVPDHFNYGLDLEVKRNLRKALETEISGPEKAILKMAKIMLDLKMAKNLDAAIATARKQYEEEMAEAAEGETEAAAS